MEPIKPIWKMQKHSKSPSVSIILSIKILYRLALVAIFCLLFTLLGIGQNVKIIYFDPTGNKYIGRFKNSLNQPYYSRPFVDLKEKLPDGTYYYVSAEEEDSAKFDLEDVIMIKSQYLDSMRTGKFQYYMDTYKKKDKNILVHEYNYSGGFLDGYYMSANSINLLNQGNYKNGKRHGFFFTYSDDGDLMKLELFQNDFLLYKSEYPDITVVQPQ